MADSHDSFYTGSTGNGRFGQHGGQYIPETLMNAVIELTLNLTRSSIHF